MAVAVQSPSTSLFVWGTELDSNHFHTALCGPESSVIRQNYKIPFIVGRESLLIFRDININIISIVIVLYKFHRHGKKLKRVAEFLHSSYSG